MGGGSATACLRLAVRPDGLRPPGLACGSSAQRPRRRQRHLAPHPRHVELEQPAVLDDLAGDVIRAGREFAQRNRLPGADSVDEPEVRRGEDAQVLAVLVVDALDALADDDLDAGHQLGVGALFAAGPLAAALAGDGADEAGVFDRAALYGGFGAAVRAGHFQPQIGEFPQRFVVEEADVGGGDLVGADLVAEDGLQLGGQLQVQPFVELAADQVGVVREEEDAAAEGDFRGPLGGRSAGEAHSSGVERGRFGAV